MAEMDAAEGGAGSPALSVKNNSLEADFGNPGQNNGAENQPGPVAPERSFEDVFKPETRRFEDVFKPADVAPSHVAVPMNGAEWRSYLDNAPLGRVISAFGSAFQGPGLTDDALEWMQKVGMGNNFTDYHAKTNDTYAQAIARPILHGVRHINDWLATAAVGSFDVLARTGKGVENVLLQGGEELGVPEAGRLGAQAVDIAMTFGHIIPGGGVRLPVEAPRTVQQVAEAGRLRPRLPEPVARARADAVIGEGEDGYFGTTVPTDADLAARRVAAADLEPDHIRGAPEKVDGEVSAETPDIHRVARQIDPETFREYDDLATRRDTFRRWIGELGETRGRNLETAPPAEIAEIDKQIAAVERKLGNAGARRRGVFEDQLEELQNQRQVLAETHTSVDTPDMARVRRDLMATDEKLRDLAPKVSAAYREAEAAMPPPEAPKSEPGAESVAPAPETVPEPSIEGVEPPAPEPAAENTQWIETTVAKRLEAMGLPADQADAAAKINAAYYRTRAARNGGRLGTAGDIFDREAPTIRSGREKVRELAQGRGSLDQAAPVDRDAIEEFERDVKQHHGLSDLSMSLTKAGDLQIGMIEVPKAERAVGRGTAAMQEISQYADENGLRIILTPGLKDDLHGTTSRGRLVNFYKRFGFVENKGRNKDFSISAGMYRDPIAIEATATPKPIDTPEFKQWFGESKVVDAHGSPQVVYHGTDKKFSAFKKNKATMGGITWFTSNRSGIENGEVGAQGSGHILDLYASIKNPAGWAEYDKLGLGELKGRGYDGVILPNKDGSFDGFVFEPNQLKSVENRGTFDPGTDNIFKQQGRGKISNPFADGRRVITLLKNADASTFMHEASHGWLADLIQDAGHPQAAADVRADVDTVLKWLGVDRQTLADISDKKGRAANEKWARGFERYLMEGRAPSQELATVFAKFKAWLTQIYQTVKSLRSNINPDIRQVFDRLLAENPEHTTIASHDEAAGGIGDRHETHAEGVSAADRLSSADRFHDERAGDIATNHPEIADELGIDRGGEAGAGAPARSGVDGGLDATGRPGGEAGGVQATGKVGQGGGQAPLGPPRPTVKYGPNRAHGLYLKVPKRPPSLADYVKAKGGVQDHNGEVSALGVKKPGLIKPDGRKIDDIALAAQEDGFFPELTERPTVREFLNKLEDDLKGNHQWSEFDEPAVAAYRNALDHNSEVDALAAELGIEQKGLSHGEFWDKVAERKSVQDQARFIEEQTTAHEDALADAEAQLKEFLETNDGRELGPIDEPKARTLEDLENERRQEEAVRGPIEGADNGQQPGAAGSDPGAVQGGGGSRGLGPEPVGRGTKDEVPVADTRDIGAAEPKRGAAVNPTDAQRRYESPNPRLVDKAGNIRIENLNVPDDVGQAIRDAAEANGGFMDARRGVQTISDQMALADALGMQPADLDMRKIGQAFNAEEIIAARKLLIDSATRVRDIMAEAANGDDAAVMAYGEARARHRMIQEHVAAITAEAGRALGAFRAFSKMDGAAEAKILDELFQSATGRTVAELREEAKAGSKLLTPGEVAKYLNDVWKPTWLDMAIEYRQAAMLWGPITFMKNALSNTLVAVYSIAEHGALALKGEIFGGDERAFAGEIAPRLFSMVEGTQRGLRIAREILKDEDFINKQPKPGDPQLNLGLADRRDVRKLHAIPGKVGEVVRFSFRALSATDAIFKSIAYQQKLTELVYRSAFKDGLTGDALETRITKTLRDPPADIMKQATHYADYQTFNQELEGFTRSLQQFAAKHPVLKIPFPYIRTPINILKYSGERSILAPFVKEARENLMGNNGKLARDEQIIRMTLGTTLSGMALYWASQGIFTGGGPADPEDRATLMLTGWKPYSFKIGDHYYSAAGLEPLGTLMGVAADVHEVGHAMNDQEKNNVMELIFASVTKNLVDKSYMSGFSDLGEFVSSPSRFAGQYLQNLASSFIPNLSAQAARAGDPYLREAHGLVQNVKARVPGLSNTLLPRRDVWGQPIERGTGVAPLDLVNPIYTSRVNNDPVNKELLALRYSPAKVDRKIRGVKLTDQQYDDYARISGVRAKMDLDALVNSPGWDQIPGHVRRSIMVKSISHAREQAASTVIMQSMGTDNDIRMKALDSKAALARDLDERARSEPE